MNPPHLEAQLSTWPFWDGGKFMFFEFHFTSYVDFKGRKARRISPATFTHTELCSAETKRFYFFFLGSRYKYEPKWVPELDTKIGASLLLLPLLFSDLVI